MPFATQREHVPSEPQPYWGGQSRSDAHVGAQASVPQPQWFAASRCQVQPGGGCAQSMGGQLLHAPFVQPSYGWQSESLPHLGHTSWPHEQRVFGSGW